METEEVVIRDESATDANQATVDVTGLKSESLRP